MRVIAVSGIPGTGKTTLAKKLSSKFNFQYLDVNKIIKKYNISEGYDRKRKAKVVDVDKLNKALIKEINTCKKTIKIIDKNIKNEFIKNSIKNEQSAIKPFKNKKTIKINDKNIKNTFNKNSAKNKFIKNNGINYNTFKNNKRINGIVIDSHLSHYLPKKYVDLCIVTKCNLKVLEKRLREKRYSKDKIRENLDAEIFDVCLNEAKENNHRILTIDTTKNIKINSIISKIKNIIKSNFYQKNHS